MRSYKGYTALIGFALMLQACRGAGLETKVPVATETKCCRHPGANYRGGYHTGGPGEFFENVTIRSGFGYRAPWLEVYFTDPVNPLSVREVSGVDALVSAAIVAAKEVWMCHCGI